MKFIRIFLLLILIVSCSNKQNTLEYYANYPVKFAKHKISHPSNDFSILIPINWEWKTMDYENENIILGIDASSKPNKDGFSDIILIQKIRSYRNSKDLKSEYDYSLRLLRDTINVEIIESGISETLKQKSYFIHTQPNTEKFGETETITFITESEKENEFYNLTASALRTDDLKLNMAMIISCLKAFEINKTK